MAQSKYPLVYQGDSLDISLVLCQRHDHRMHLSASRQDQSKRRRQSRLRWNDRVPQPVSLVWHFFPIAGANGAMTTPPFSIERNTVKSLFSTPALNYFNRCRTTGAKKKRALKRGRRLTFQWKIMDLRLLKRTQHTTTNTGKRPKMNKKPRKDKICKTGPKKREALIYFNHALTTGGN